MASFKSGEGEEIAGQVSYEVREKSWMAGEQEKRFGFANSYIKC